MLEFYYIELGLLRKPLEAFLFFKVFFFRGNVYFKQYLLSAGWLDIGWIMGAQNGINRQLSNGLTDSRQRASKYFRVNRQGKEWLLVHNAHPIQGLSYPNIVFLQITFEYNIVKYYLKYLRSFEKENKTERIKVIKNCYFTLCYSLEVKFQ